MNSLSVFLPLLYTLLQGALIACADPHGAAGGKKFDQVTKYACENNWMTISCPPTQVIRIVRANYGRFSLYVCNDEGMSWPNTQCMDPDSTRVMTERCDEKQSCVISVNDYTFTDHCYDTHKYLEVTYECADQQPSAISDSIPNNESGSILAIDPVASGKTAWASTNLPTFMTTLGEGDASGPVFSVHESASSCPRVEAKGMLWPKSQAGSLVRVPCPNDLNTDVEAKCAPDGRWIPELPDLSHCISPWVRDLESVEVAPTNQSIDRALDSVREISLHALSGGDITETSAHVKRVVKAVLRIYEKKSLNEQRRFYGILSKIIISTLSSVLSRQNALAWSYMSVDQQRYAANLLMSSVEECAKRLSATMQPGSSPERFWSSQIVMEVSVEPLQNWMQFPSSSKHDARVDSVRLHSSVVGAHYSTEWFKMIFVKFDGLGEILRPSESSDTSGRNEKRVVSSVITAIAPELKEHDSFREPIILTFYVPKAQNLTNPQCVFWDSKMNSQGIFGEWSTEGCDVVAQNDTHVQCSCNHLTSFAVLMDINGIDFSPTDKAALSWISYIGCTISVICLTSTIITFNMFHYLQCERMTIHKNLCFCLLVAELVFMFGIWQTTDRLICGLIAVLLHYFFLCAFAWMLLEGFQLYSLLVEVFEPKRSRKLCYYLFGYGAPLLVVGISLAVDWNSYGTDNHCWLRTENYFVFSFVGPVVTVMTANFILLFVAMAIIARHAPYSNSLQSSEKSKFLHRVRFWIKGALVLVVLLGLTWSLGILLVSHSAVAVAYSFTILNSLQGLFIFYFQVLMNKKIREMWKTWFARNVCSLNRSNRRYASCYGAPQCNRKLCTVASESQLRCAELSENMYCHNDGILVHSLRAFPEDFSNGSENFFKTSVTSAPSEIHGRYEYAAYAAETGTQKVLQLYRPNNRRPPPKCPPPELPALHYSPEVLQDHSDVYMCPLDSVPHGYMAYLQRRLSGNDAEVKSCQMYSTRCGSAQCRWCSGLVTPLLDHNCMESRNCVTSAPSPVQRWNLVTPLPRNILSSEDLESANANHTAFASKRQLCLQCAEPSYEVPIHSPGKLECACCKPFYRTKAALR